MRTRIRSRLRPVGRSRRDQRGQTMLELALAMGISAFLALAGLPHWDIGRLELDAAQHDLAESLDQAFVLARARGTNITVAVGAGQGPDILPVRLGPRVLWGKPTSVPLPTGMEPPTRATTTGEAHRTLTVTPRHTATASLWFLHAGEETLCVRLSGRGRIHLLRWRPARRRWTRV